MFRSALRMLTVFAGLQFAIPAQGVQERYAVILNTPPVKDRKDPKQAEAVRAAQTNVKAALEKRGIRVLSSTQLVANAIYVLATPEQVEELKKLPGVARVEPMKRYRRQR